MKNEDISFSYDQLWKFIIRPSRDVYDIELLGKPIFMFNNKKYERKDYNIMSSQGYILKCSFIQPLNEYRPSHEMPVVLYLHGNSSSRIEGLHISNELLKRNINVFLIDFAGCGLSEGEYISLGYHESNDVKNIIDFLEKIEGVGEIGVWGRSMGAATAMLYAHKDKRIKAICLDSPFSDFIQLVKELIWSQINLPEILITGMLKIIRLSILNKNGLDIEKLRPIDYSSKTFQPIFFVHAKNDSLINIKHSMELLSKYGGNIKKMKCLEKLDHNSVRDSSTINEIGEFFELHLIKFKQSYNKKIEYVQPKISIEEEDFMLNNINYMKKKEENVKKEISKMSILLRSINKIDIKKSISNNNIKLNDKKIEEKKNKSDDIFYKDNNKKYHMKSPIKNYEKQNQYMKKPDNSNKIIINKDQVNKIYNKKKLDLNNYSYNNKEISNKKNNNNNNNNFNNKNNNNININNNSNQIPIDCTNSVINFNNCTFGTRIN